MSISHAFYNPVWTIPDGFSWIEALTDDSLIGLHFPDTRLERNHRNFR